MHNPETREEACRLRQSGVGLAGIAERLGVAKSTVSLWTRGLRTDTEVGRDRLRNIRRVHGLLKLKASQRAERTNVAAHSEWQHLRSDPLFLLGVGIYIGEGNKTKRFGLTNANPSVIRSWAGWCRKFAAGVEFRGCIMAHPDLDESVLRQFWSEVSGVKSICYWTKPVAVPRTGSAATSRHGTFQMIAKRGAKHLLQKMLVWSELALNTLQGSPSGDGLGLQNRMSQFDSELPC